MTQLLIVLATIIGLVIAADQRQQGRIDPPPPHDSDDCIGDPRNTDTHIRVPRYKVFCMGSKKDAIYYGMRTGCFADASCDYFMSAKIIVNPKHRNEKPHMQWNLFAKQGNIVFFLSKNLININLNLTNIEYVTVLNTTAYPTKYFISHHFPGGKRDPSWGNVKKFNSFQEDPGGDGAYETKRVLEVGPKANPIGITTYDRVSVTTWNQGNDTEKTWVPNAKIYPLIPYLIGIKRTSDPPEVTVISPKQFLYLFSDDVTKMTALNTVADHFYLGGGEVTTTTPAFIDKINDWEMSYIWFIVGGVIAVVLLYTICCCCPTKKK